MTLPEVITSLQRECAAAGSQTAWAKAHGLSLQHVNDVLHGRKAPGASILAALGLERVTTYKDNSPYILITS